LTQLRTLKRQQHAKAQQQETQGTHESPEEEAQEVIFSLTDYSNYLPKTCQFLWSSLSAGDVSSGEMITGELKAYLLECNVREELLRVSAIGQRRDVDLALIAHSFCHLLQSPFALLSSQGSEVLPETLQWDVERLSFLRQQIDTLAVSSTLLLTTKQFLLLRRCRINSEDEVSFYFKLNELLKSDHVTRLHLIEEIKLFILSQFSSQSQAPSLPYPFLPSPSLPSTSLSSPSLSLLSPPSPLYLSKEIEISLQNSIQQSLLSTSPILQLFTKRIYKLLTRGLLSLSFQELLPAYSLQSKQQSQEIRSLILQAKRIFDHSILIFGPFYSAILRSYVSSRDDSSSSSL
jgi:hypothetical protein